MITLCVLVRLCTSGGQELAPIPPFSYFVSTLLTCSECSSLAALAKFPQSHFRTIWLSHILAVPPEMYRKTGKTSRFKNVFTFLGTFSRVSPVFCQKQAHFWERQTGFVLAVTTHSSAYLHVRTTFPLYLTKGCFRPLLAFCEKVGTFLLLELRFLIAVRSGTRGE